jgi:hypothetical protein
MVNWGAMFQKTRQNVLMWFNSPIPSKFPTMALQPFPESEQKSSKIREKHMPATCKLFYSTNFRGL